MFVYYDPGTMWPSTVAPFHTGLLSQWPYFTMAFFCKTSRLVSIVDRGLPKVYRGVVETKVCWKHCQYLAYIPMVVEIEPTEKEFTMKGTTESRSFCRCLIRICLTWWSTILVKTVGFSESKVLWFFPCHFLLKAKRSVGNKESGLEKIIVDMLHPKIKLRWRQNLHLCNINR